MPFSHPQTFCFSLAQLFTIEFCAAHFYNNSAPSTHTGQIANVEKLAMIFI